MCVCGGVVILMPVEAVSQRESPITTILGLAGARLRE